MHNGPPDSIAYDLAGQMGFYPLLQISSGIGLVIWANWVTFRDFVLPITLIVIDIAWEDLRRSVMYCRSVILYPCIKKMLLYH